MDNATFLINTATFLATQKQRCSNPKDGNSRYAQCFYADGKGNRCAIGAYFTEELAARLQSVIESISARMILAVANRGKDKFSDAGGDPCYNNRSNKLYSVCTEAAGVLEGVDLQLLTDSQILHDKTPYRDQSNRQDMVNTLASTAAVMGLESAAETIRAINVPESLDD